MKILTRIKKNSFFSCPAETQETLEAFIVYKSYFGIEFIFTLFLIYKHKVYKHI